MHVSPTHPVYRIGIDARLYRKATGGIGRYSRELLYHLFALDAHNLYFVFLTEADLQEWEINQPNVTPVVVDIPHYTLKEQTAFAKLLYSYKLDLVHFLNFNHPMAYVRPFVVTLHDLTVLHMPTAARITKKDSVKFQAFKLVLKRSVTKAKKIIAISEYVASDAEHALKVPHAKMEVVYEGGPQPAKLPFGSKKMVQDYLQIRQPYILFVSQWRAHKGIMTLLEAFAAFKQKTGLPHQLVLLGNQSAAPAEVRKTITESPVCNEIITPGFAPDELLPLLYSYASAFVMPSEYEGFGLPVLEAFAYGAPVIIADASSLPEVAGSAALRFPARDAAQLAAQLERITTDAALVEDLRQSGMQQLHKFSWAACAEQTLATYYSILEKRH